MKFWVSDAQLPIQTEIQFKFFRSPQENICPLEWIGNIESLNFKLLITPLDVKRFENEKKSRQLKIMSFNIRREKQVDKNEFSWENRKINCLNMIKQQLPSIICLQQATINQNHYLLTNLQDQYYPVTQNLTETVTILYDKQRFLQIQSGCKFISEVKKPQKPLNTNEPVFSYAILEDTYCSEKLRHQLHKGQIKSENQFSRQLFCVFDIYLGFHSFEQQKKAISLVLEQIKEKNTEFKGQIKDFFFLGDFNLPQNSNLLSSLQKSQLSLQSIRKNLLKRHMKDSCDVSYTFHAFEHDDYDVQNPQKIIDHFYISGKDYEPIKFQVIRSLIKKSKHSKNPITSDHYPIVGIFRHKKGELKAMHA